MSGWVQQLGKYIHSYPLDFGVRAGAAFLALVGAVLLGRWLQGVISRFPVRVEAALGRGGRLTSRQLPQMSSGLSRWLGRVAFVSVLLAGAQIIVLIVEYGNPQAPTLNQHAVRSYLENLAPPLIATLLIAPLTLGVGRVLQRVTVAALARLRVDKSLMVLGGRIIYAASLVVGVLVILSIWGVPPLLTGALLGAITLALSLALQDVLRNIFAGIYLLVERPFVAGDEIAVDKYAGTVEGVQLRVTSLRAESGQRVLVPNAMLFTSAVVNNTAYQRRRIALAVTLPPDGADNLDQVEQAIRGAVERVQGVLAVPPPTVALSHAGQDKVDLHVVFWVPANDAQMARGALSAAVDQVRTALDQADVSVADTTAVPA